MRLFLQTKSAGVIDRRQPLRLAGCLLAGALACQLAWADQASALDPQSILDAAPPAVTTVVSQPVNQAAPTAGTEDPVGQMLKDRGLIDTHAILEAARQTQEKAAAKVRDWASDLVISSMAYLGVPYRFGGNSQETGFDCSGFTSHVYQRVLGLRLPHRASDQAQMSGMQDVAMSELKPGDLVFFNTLRRTFSHVGIYIGNNRFIHAPRAGTVVRIEDMGQSYWQQRFNGARRAEVVSALNTGSTTP